VSNCKVCGRELLMSTTGTCIECEKKEKESWPTCKKYGKNFEQLIENTQHCGAYDLKKQESSTDLTREMNTKKPKFWTPISFFITAVAVLLANPIFIKFPLQLGGVAAGSLKRANLAGRGIATCYQAIILVLWLALIVVPVEADNRAFQSSVVAENGITTERISPGEARKAFDDYLIKLRSGKGSEAIDIYFDAMTYIKLSFSHHLLVLNHNELDDLKKELVNWMKKFTNMPESRNYKHKIIGERINPDGFAEVEYLDAYGTSFEMKHTVIFRKVNGRLLYFDMHREGESMPKMLGKLYSQYSGEMSPLAFVKALND